MKKFTFITLLYKTGSSTDRKLVALEGAFTESLFTRANNALYKGGLNSMFIPSELGLPSASDNVISEFGYDEEIDFAGVYIQEFHYAEGDFENFCKHIEGSSNESVEAKFTVEAFVIALESADYDALAETERLQALE